MKLPIAIHKDPDSTYGVTVPDVVGCFSAGDTIAEAIKNAGDAIYLHISTMLEMGETIDLHASRIDDLVEQEGYAGAIWAMVDVDLSKLDTKAERVNITLPRFVLTKIDSYVASRPGENRSGFLARAALQMISDEARGV